jgi:F-type H+-transporting ATPase subunit delta
MLSVVAARYAKALVDVVAAPASKTDPAAVLAELRSVQELIKTSPDVRSALASPAVAPSRKRAVMKRLTDPPFRDVPLLPQVRNFIYVVIDHRRVDQLGSFIDAFETLLDERLGFISADVKSARELSAAQKASLEAQVARIAGRKARLKFTMDPALIAGVVAHVGSRVYDGSVRGQLDRLRAKLGRG